MASVNNQFSSWKAKPFRYKLTRMSYYNFYLEKENVVLEYIARFYS